jgi:predicted GH43/DUF377 family glycosyl hydrolase
MSKSHTWKRHPGNPVFPAEPGTWRAAQTANPDLLRLGDTWFMYFRGQADGHDRIGVATVPAARFDGITWDIHPQPIIDVGGPGTPDEEHALDPATVLVDGRVYLYYSAVSPTCSRSVCLATSDDGVRFEKHAGSPVMIGGGPEVVYQDGIFHLFYWKERAGTQGFELWTAHSDDGVHFEEWTGGAILPVGPPGAWDSRTVETPRIFREGDTYYMVYCGSDRFNDYPWDAGLATSRDLLTWEKYSGNPIFSRGNEGAWDEGAIWFTTVEKVGNTYYMWYEGYGGGTARTEQYGTYLTQGRSQIGLATLRADSFYAPESRAD